MTDHQDGDAGTTLLQVRTWVQDTHGQAAVGAAASDSEGRLAWVNQAMLNLIGRTAGSVLGRPVASLVNHADRA
jgi:PAS domain-containing protein